MTTHISVKPCSIRKSARRTALGHVLRCVLQTLFIAARRPWMLFAAMAVAGDVCARVWVGGWVGVYVCVCLCV